MRHKWQFDDSRAKFFFMQAGRQVGKSFLSLESAISSKSLYFLKNETYKIVKRNGEEIHPAFIAQHFCKPKCAFTGFGGRKRHRRGHIYRHMRTTQERTAQCYWRYDAEDLNTATRISGRKRKLRMAWDDVSHCPPQKNWKQYRSKQYRTTKLSSS